MRKFFWFFLLLLLFSSIARSEIRKQYDLNEIIVNAITLNQTSPLVISNADIRTDNLKYRYLFEYLEITLPPDQLHVVDDKVVINTPLIFKNCHFNNVLLDRLSFKGNLNFMFCQIDDGIELSGSNFNELTFEDCVINRAAIDNCTFDDHFIAEWNQIDALKVTRSRFNGITKLINDVRYSIEVYGCVFSERDIPCSIQNDSIGYGREMYDNLQFVIGSVEMKTIDLVALRNNDFVSEQTVNKVAVQAEMNQLIIEDNKFGSAFDLNKTVVGKRLIIKNNHFENPVGFNDVIFPELFNMVEWSQFAGFKLCIYESKPGSYQFNCPPNYKKIQRISDLNNVLYMAENNDELSNTDSYNLLISIYQRLYNIYRNNGDIRSSNGCYSEMKDVQSRMLAFRFHENRTFNNFFRWKLAQLLKVYVDHGTDPARAITISVYVILLFAIFYFFFPSEWDVTSKSKMLKEFSQYLKKINRDNLRQFLVVTWGLFLSLVNAITLSLNAFTTLGFGNIPTKGLARYICVVQGFIGWFLLSIFTVALINQVLG